MKYDNSVGKVSVASGERLRGGALCRVCGVRLQKGDICVMVHNVGWYKVEYHLKCAKEVSRILAEAIKSQDPAPD